MDARVHETSSAQTRSKRPHLYILGGGSVTTEYYLPALRLMDRLANVSVIDPDAGSIKQQRQSFTAVDFRDQDYVSFLDGLAPSARNASNIIVALPNQLHVDAVRRALTQGCHVLCEKPLALTATECADLRTLAGARQRLLKVGMSRRYLPSLMLAREIANAGELGKIRSIEVHDCTPFLWRPRSFAFFAREAGGVLADMGVHYLDYLGTLVGAMVPVTYTDDARGGTESSLDYTLAAGDVRIAMRLSRIYQSGAYLKIHCERGEIHVEKQNENEVLVAPSERLTRRISAESPFDDPSWPRNFQGSFCQMLADFERAVGGLATPLADVADAERTTALIEWAYAQRHRAASAAPARPASSHAPGKVLITGATGFIGGHLVERLSLAGSDVHAAARAPDKCANVARFPVKIVPTDLLDPRSARAAVAGARVVYHLAYGTDPRHAAQVTIEGTKNIVEAAIAAGAECVVVLSTMYVFGFPEGRAPVDESFPYRPYGGEYGQSKAIMERWCLDRARSSLPTRIVVLNPTCVFGPGGGAYTTLPVDLLRQGQFCWISDGTGFCNYSYVENLVDAIVTAADTPAAHGNRFIINDGTVTWRELLEPMIQPFARHVIASFTPRQLEDLPRYGGSFRVADLANAMLSSPEVREVAKRSKLARRLLARARATRSSDILPTPSNQKARADRERRYPPEWLATLYGPAKTSFSAGKAENILRWRPAVDLADAQRKTLEWLIESRGLPEHGK